MGSFLGADILNQVTLVAPDGHWDTTNRSEWLVAGGQRVREDGQGRGAAVVVAAAGGDESCLLYTSPSPRDQRGSRMPSSA